MTTSAPNDNAGITGQVPMYGDPEPLDVTRHAKLGIKSSESPFGFAAKQHFVPLHINEFGVAAISYPIIFAGDARTPLAVMGLREGENQFISEAGSFRPGTYVPVFIRRYPFISAIDSVNNREIVCIDRACPQWTEDNPDFMLFEDGKPTAYTTGCIEFCSMFSAGAQRTERFVAEMTALDLFEPRQATYTPRNADGSTAGEPLLLAEFFAISEDKLNALATEKLVELRDNGALAQIYAHMVSLVGWERVVSESMTRAAALEKAGKA